MTDSMFHRVEYVDVVMPSRRMLTSVKCLCGKMPRGYVYRDNPEYDEEMRLIDEVVMFHLDGKKGEVVGKRNR